MFGLLEPICLVTFMADECNEEIGTADDAGTTWMVLGEPDGSLVIRPLTGWPRNLTGVPPPVSPTR